MGSRFLLTLLTLLLAFSPLHPSANGSPSNPKHVLSRALLQKPEGIPDPEMPLPSADQEPEHYETETPAEAPAAEGRKMARHRSTDKSVAGGGVIIGGLVTAIFAAVYCYIRVTRRRHQETLT